jgi:GT2 family glycosyltransferase
VISVVMPVLNGMPWIQDQLEALAGQQCAEPWEVVVADNGSTDAGPAVMAAYAERFPALRVVDASGRRGPGAARNAGVAVAAGDRLVFCDADDVVAPGWLSALAAGLEEADVVAGTFDLARLNGGPVDVGPVPAATAQLGFLPAGLASNLGVRRAAFDAVGGFDETFRVGEDVDCCWRLQLAGYRFAHVEGAVVARREPGPLGAVFRQALAYGRSGPRLYRRHRVAGARRAGRAALRSWAWLVLSLPRLSDDQIRRQWVRAVGVRVGRLVGSVEHGVVFP